MTLVQSVILTQLRKQWLTSCCYDGIFTISWDTEIWMNKFNQLIGLDYIHKRTCFCYLLDFQFQLLWFSQGTLVSSTNKTDRHHMTEILLKVVLNIMGSTTDIQVWIYRDIAECAIGYQDFHFSSNLRYLCLCPYSGIHHILCFYFSSSCAPYVVSFSGLFLLYSLTFT